MRIGSVLLGGVIALGVVGVMMNVAHIAVLMALFVATLWMTQNILTGPGNYRLYHAAGTVMISLVAGIIMSTEPGYAFFQRAVLTSISTVIAALLILVLDDAFVRPKAAAAA